MGVIVTAFILGISNLDEKPLKRNFGHPSPSIPRHAAMIKEDTYFLNIYVSFFK